MHTVVVYAVMFASIIILLIALHRLHDRFFIAPIMLIIAGGVSNLVDRIMYGAVIDPISIGNWQGNSADIALFLGIIWVAWGMMKHRNVTLSHARTH